MPNLVKSFVIVLSLIIAQGVANASPLGLDPTQIPDPPSSSKPTMKAKDRRAAIAHGELPEVLVPIKYMKNGKVGGGKYYDEDGQVYRLKEVGWILGASPASTASAAEYERHRTIALGWSYASIALLPVAPLNALLLVPAFPHITQEWSYFRGALQQYNGQAHCG